MHVRTRQSFTAQCEKTAKDRFTYIYQQALRLNKAALVKLSKKESLNVRQGMQTPVAKLAYNGFHDAVNLLLKLGANTEDAMFGYAAKNDLLKVAEIGEGYKRSQAQGYVFAKNPDRDTNILQIIREDQSIIPGVYLAAVVANRPEIINLLEKLTDIITQKKIIDTQTKIKCAAIAGNLHPLGDFEQSQENVAAAIEGFLMGGYYVLAEKLLTEKILNEHNLNLLEAYAASGNTDHVQMFGKNAPRIIAFAYAKARHHSYVEELFLEHKLDITPIADGYITGGCFENKNTALSLFSVLSNTDLQKQIADAIDNNVTPLCAMVNFQVKPLLRIAQKIRHTHFFTHAHDIPTAAIIRPEQNLMPNM